jgi:hypothetical protein
MLMELQLEAAVSVFHIETAAREGVFDCGGERFVGTNL